MDWPQTGDKLVTLEERVRKAQTMMDGGMSAKEACKKLGMAPSHFYNKRKKMGLTSGEPVTKTNGEFSGDWRDVAAVAIINSTVTADRKLALVKTIFGN